MASTYTSNSGVEKPGIGDQSGEWGTTVNTNMDILDRAINGVGVITLSGTTHTLTTTDGALSDGQYKVLVLSGSPSGTNTITISPNDQDKLYFVVNNSGQTATFSQGSGANVSVVNGDTKIIYADGAGSGAAVTEFASEADALEGITAGTVSASKAVIVDANKDITGFRNVTLTGELDAGSLDISGNADIDGTLEADAMTLDGTAITTTATLSTGISNGNLPVFTTGVADDDFLRVAGTSIEGRSASEVLSDIGGQASLTFGISNTNAVKIDSASVADDEYARFTASGLESRSTAEVLSDIGASPVAGSGSIVTTGALNSGSITSGFGSIDNGSSAITTTGVITGGTVEATTDTAAGDNAAIGYTAAEGLILTGQGSTSDVTIKNDADATVISIPTGTTQVGIGTTTPSAELGFPIGNDVEISQVAVTAHQAGNAGHIGLTIADGGGHAGFFVNNTHDGTYSDTHLTFKTGEGGVSVATERMRITPNGNVGIGTSAATTYANSMGNTLVVGTGNNFAVIQGRTDGPAGATNGVNYGGSYASNPINGARMFIGAAGGAGQRGLITFNTKNTDDDTNQPTEAMRIASDGKVGIGTSSPSSYTSDTLVISSGDQGGMTLVSADNVENYISWADGTSGAAQLQAGFIGYNHASNYLRFGTIATERMRIRSNGQVLINQTSIIASDNAYLQVTGGSVTPVALRGGTNNYFMAFYKQSNDDLIGSITGSSGTATAFNTSSDYRLKENVDYSWDATTRLKQLKPARFNFIADPDNTVDGFIAHEVQEVVPHAVTGVKDGEEMQGIDHSKLVPLLTASLQEALKRIDSLEEQVNALKGK